jgi:hypothetical protein
VPVAQAVGDLGEPAAEPDLDAGRLGSAIAGIAGIAGIAVSSSGLRQESQACADGLFPWLIDAIDAEASHDDGDQLQ